MLLMHVGLCLMCVPADDYYGGYENLALFTNWETGDVDFESAYNYANFDGDFW